MYSILFRLKADKIAATQLKEGGEVVIRVSGMQECLGQDQVSQAESWENPGDRDRAGQSISLRCAKERSLPLEGVGARPQPGRPSQGWRGAGEERMLGFPEKDQDQEGERTAAPRPSQKPSEGHPILHLSAFDC